MTETEFRRLAALEDDAASAVRLQDRSRCSRENEWYRPFVDDDGTMKLDCMNGTTLTVDPDLLEQLRPPVPSGTTAGELVNALQKLDPSTRVFIETAPGRYADPSPAPEQITAAIEAFPPNGNRQEPVRHGTGADALAHEPVAGGVAIVPRASNDRGSTGTTG